MDTVRVACAARAREARAMDRVRAKQVRAKGGELTFFNRWDEEAALSDRL